MVPVHAATYIHNLHMIRDIVFGFFKYHKFSHNEMITLFQHKYVFHTIFLIMPDTIIKCYKIFTCILYMHVHVCSQKLSKLFLPIFPFVYTVKPI